MQSLLPCQQTALAFIRNQATRENTRARSEIMAVLARAGLAGSHYADAVAGLQSRAQVALHFHPDRLSRTRKSVAEGLLEAGVYKNQFETGLSSGSPSAFPGGRRDQWENQLFGGSYHAADVSASTRPKYGALHVIDHPDGPAPRFGSCYFLLRREVSWRCTFTFGGSHEAQALERTGTLDALEPVMAPLLAQLERGEGALGCDGLTVPGLLTHLARRRSEPVRSTAGGPLGRALDSFIESQIHGEVHLCDDVDQLIADPAFRDHPVGELLSAISTTYEIPLTWHPGFTLPVAAVPEVFRGYLVRSLAERIGGSGILDAAKIGMAANSFELDPSAWKDWASPKDTLTQFRRLWHVLVQNGSPRRNTVQPST